MVWVVALTVPTMPVTSTVAPGVTGAGSLAVATGEAFPVAGVVVPAAVAGDAAACVVRVVGVALLLEPPQAASASASNAGASVGVSERIGGQGIGNGAGEREKVRTHGAKPGGHAGRPYV